MNLLPAEETGVYGEVPYRCPKGEPVLIVMCFIPPSVFAFAILCQFHIGVGRWRNTSLRFINIYIYF